MVSISDPLTASIIFYIVSIFVIMDQKPRLFFNENGDIREFGFQDDQTPFPLNIVSILLAIFTYLIMNIYSVL